MTDSEKIKALYKEIEEAEQILGKALGYPPFPIYKGMDFSKIPAEKTDLPDSDWVCIGDHTLVTLCMEAVDMLQRNKTALQSKK